VLSEEILALQQETKNEQQIRIDIEKQCREKVEQMKEKLKRERKLRAEANNTLEQLNKKVKDLEMKYSKELLYYKEAAFGTEEQIKQERMRYEKIFEKVCHFEKQKYRQIIASWR